MRIIGLTGGIGSGKSAAAKRFAELGVPVIDADQVGHDVIAPGGAAEPEVKAAFGEGVVRDGKIDRDLLGQRVFGDEAALQQLNAIVHPSIIAEIGRRCAKYACDEGVPAVVIEATLIGERGRREPWLDGLVLVDAPLEVRLERLAALRGMQREDAMKRVEAQSDPQSKRGIADWVVDNGGGLDALHAQVDMIFQELLESGAE